MHCLQLLTMEEDSFAFYIFSGFVAISTVISWAIVTYITRENTYENAKRQAQEDMSWMENNSTQNTPIKGNIKAPKVKKFVNLNELYLYRD